MKNEMELSGLYVEPGVTEAVKELAELESDWTAANAEKDAAWQRLRGQPYNPRMVDRFNAKSDLCSMLTHQIIRHKRSNQI